jgi:SAM-dependent methyltransferase
MVSGDAGLLVEHIPADLLVEAVEVSLDRERGKRLHEYNVLKWWGRRFAVLTRLFLSSLVLLPDETVYVGKILYGEVPKSFVERSRGKLVLDPFSGGGTIIVEAARLGFDVYGIDVNPAAVEVSRATAGIVTGETCSKLQCLVEALYASWKRVRKLWVTYDGSVVVHIFLAWCREGVCRAPAWITTLKRKPRKKIVVLDPGDPSGLRLVEGEEADRYTPKEPVVDLPVGLPEEAEGLVAYAVELYKPADGVRRLIPLFTSEAHDIRAWLDETRPPEPDVCTPIPYMKESRRLFKAGLKCWEQIYTPRQHQTLRIFIEEASKRGCGQLAKLFAGNASRTCSLLAIYYQPYSKVNPGLVVKSYWLPDYPVELNPIAFRESARGYPVSIGRGTIASYISALARACKAAVTSANQSINVRMQVVHGDARRSEFYPQEAYAVVTDPPYPGMQSYQDMSLLYLYWLNHLSSIPSDSPFNGESYIELMRGFGRAAYKSLQSNGYLVLFIGAPQKNVKTLANTIKAITKEGFGLRKIYWFPGEAPGKLGRSLTRGVYAVVFRKDNENSPDAFSLLRSVEYMLETMESDTLKKLNINANVEKENIRTLIQLLQSEKN